MSNIMNSFMTGKSSTETRPQTQLISPWGTPGSAQASQGIVSGLNQNLPAVNQYSGDIRNSYNTAAGSPGFSQAYNLGNQTLRGDFLGGTPQFKAQLASLDASGNRQAADMAARTRSAGALQGVPGLSTASLQALQAGNAAARAQTNEQKVGAIAQNAAMERGFQNQAPQMMTQALATPLAMREQGMSASLAPYMTLAQALQTADRPMVQQGLDYHTTTKPSLFNDLGALTQEASSIYGMVNPMYGMATGGSGGGSSAANFGNGSNDYMGSQFQLSPYQAMQYGAK